MFIRSSHKYFFSLDILKSFNILHEEAREREREKERQKERQRKRQKERERERERDLDFLCKVQLYLELKGYMLVGKQDGPSDGQIASKKHLRCLDNRYSFITCFSRPLCSPAHIRGFLRAELDKTTRSF